MRLKAISLYCDNDDCHSESIKEFVVCHITKKYEAASTTLYLMLTLPQRN